MEENKENNEQNVEQATQNKPEAEQKKTKSEKDEKKSIVTSFKEFRGECKKIIWPSRKDILKGTTTVVVTSIGFGLLVFVMDTIFSFGYTAFIDLLSKI